MEGDDGDEQNWNRWKEAGFRDNDVESAYDSHEEREEIEEALYAHIFFQSQVEGDVDDPSDDKNVKQFRNMSNHHISDNSLPGTNKEEKLVPVSSPLDDSVDLQRFKSDTFFCNGFIFEKTIVPVKKSDAGVLTSPNFDSSRNQSTVSKHVYRANKKLYQQFEKSKKNTSKRITFSDTSISEDLNKDIHEEDNLSDSTYSDDINLEESLSDMDDIDVHVNESQRILLKKYGNCHSSSDTDPDWAVEPNNSDISLGAKNRYYLVRPLNIQCYNCKETGHMSRDCPNPKKSPVCYLCGFTGHTSRTCPQRICYNCYELGHEVKLCPYSQQHRWRTCYRCNMYGHEQDKCPDIWRCYHMTTVPGKLVKKDTVNKKIFCYNCAAAGHFGFECEEKRMDRCSNPTYPFIAQYKLVHTGTKEKHSETKKHKKHKHFDSDVEELPQKKLKTKRCEKKKEISSVLKQKDSTLKNNDNVSIDIDIPTFVAYSKGLEPGNDSLKGELPWKDNENYSAKGDNQTGDNQHKVRLDKQTQDHRNNNARLDKHTGDHRNSNARLDEQTGDHRNNNALLDKHTGDHRNNNARLDKQTHSNKNNNARLEEQTDDHKNAKFDRQTCDHKKYSDDEDLNHQFLDNVSWHKISSFSDTLNVTGAHTSRKISKKGKKKKSKHSMDKTVVKETKQKYSKKRKEPKTENDKTNFEGPDEPLGGYDQLNKRQKKNKKKNKKEEMNKFDKGKKSKHVNNDWIGNEKWQSSSTVTDLRIHVMNTTCTMEQHGPISNGIGKRTDSSSRPNQDRQVIKKDRGFRKRVNVAK
ncbi:hypothetical protein ACJMK2_034400 [Sinanodonta woodiana]|uniref:Zinc finger CCHC domain-containing protein 7 n=1 Tax=Sinanodonta woodiana TaxID=1069815 RepID=A0ABD3WUY1_SINWO